MRKQLGWILFAAYCVFLLWLTIFSRTPRSTEHVFKWQLLWAYRAWLAGAPDGKAESIQNLKNIMVFMPFGLLFSCRKWRSLVLTALIFSATIELIQYAFNLGWCEIDDVICNVLGAAIGFGIWKLIKGKRHAA